MHVAIVGAGPAGATLSLLLARNDVQVTLLERESDFDRVFRGEGLMPSGVDALHQMGLGGLLDSLPFRILESWDIFIDGQAIMSVPEPYEELGDRAMRVIPQKAFLEAVIDQATQFADFTFIRNADARALLQTDGRVQGIAFTADSQTRDLDADLVIGCDGRGSLMRTQAGLQLNRLPVQYDIVWFKMPAPERLRDTCRMMIYASTTGMGISYTSWDARLQFALVQMKGERLELSTAQWADKMARPVPAWLAAHIRSVTNDIEGPVRLNVIAGQAESWHAPGLLLLGDAAHPMSPIRAQGINLAFRDAIVAANHLVPVLARRGDREAVDDALARIQTEREPEVSRSQVLQHRDSRGIGTWYAPLLIGLAGFIGPKLGKYRWAQQAWLRQQRDLRFGSRNVKLAV